MERSSKGVILLIHGNSTSSRSFDTLAASGDIRHKIHTIDLPGHGKKRKDGTDAFTFPGLTEALIRATKAIKKPILLAGHSLGGNIAIRAAPFIPTLRGLIVFGTAPLKKPLNMEEAFLPNEDLGNYYVENPKEEVMKHTFAKSVVDPAFVPFLMDEFYKTNGKVRAALGALIGNPDQHPDEVGILRELGCKKLLIHGEFDPYVSKDYLVYKMVK